MRASIKVKSPMTNIESPHNHDVLCGRGGAIHKHVGNYTFRNLVLLNKNIYFKSKKSEKIKIARSLVNAIRGQLGGRFLKFDPQSSVWNDIGDTRAIAKTSQALREGQGDTKRKIFGRDHVVEHSETERTSTITGPSATSTTSHSHHDNPINLTSVQCECVIEDGYKRLGYEQYEEGEVVCGEKIDSSAFSEASHPVEKVSDEEEINHLIYQTFSKDANYWSKHIPKLPSMDQITIWDAKTNSQEERHNLNQNHSEKRKHENLEMVTSSSSSVHNNNDNMKYRRTEYSYMLGQNPNFNSKAIISDTKRDRISSNHDYLFKYVTGNSNSHYTMQHTQKPKLVWYGGRSA